MPESNSQDKFEVAVSLNLLNEKQLEAIELEQQTSKRSPLEISIKKGFISRKQLELLDILADPLSVVPGYRIEGFLGQGGVGTVYKATQLRMDRPVAIKTINSKTARNELTPKRFEREAKIVGRLRHPNIISAFDFGIHNQQLYLVMEFVDGIDAEKLLNEKTQIPEFQAWHIAQQVCHALGNAKQHDVIHRDIKPGNLILTAAPAGTQLPANVPFVKVADFGLAKFNDQQLDATITIEHAVNGTPFYMSPEQVKANKIDHRSDIYSLGASIWHLITGEPPVSGAGPLDVIASKVKLEDEWLSEAPDDISSYGFQLLKKMCRFDRDQRIGDYTSLTQEIESVIEQLRKDSRSGEFELVDFSFSAPAKVTAIQEIAKTIHGDSDSQSLEPSESLATWKMDVPKSSMHLEQPEKLHGEPPSRDKSSFLWIATAIGAILLLAATIIWLPTLKNSISGQDHSNKIIVGGDTLKESFLSLETFEGPLMPLFNGRSIDPTQKFTGTWEPATGLEQGTILSGIGTRNFRCCDNRRKPLRHFRFVCGFRHNMAETIGFCLLDENEDRLWEVDIKRDEATLTLKNAAASSTCPIQQFDKEKSFGYHQFRIESQPNHWRIQIDNKLLGDIPKSNSQLESEFTIQLYVAGDKPAHFDELNFRSFKSN